MKKKKKFTLRKVKKYINKCKINFFNNIKLMYKGFINIMKDTFKEIKTNKELTLSLLLTFISITSITLAVVFVALKPSINLIGDKTIKLKLNEEYKEIGYTSKYFNEDLTSKVKVTNNIDTSKVGSYSVTYKVKSSKSFLTTTVSRNIIVVDDEKPVITLEGKEITIMYLNEEYKEKGYTAIDNYDGDITDKVIINNNIDNTKEGNYIVTYVVSDSSNNITIVERNVKVVKKYTTPTTAVPTVTGTVGSTSMVELAQKQLGNIGGETYWRWYGLNYREEWCAIFIDWLANELGYSEDIIPKTASVPAMVNWFRGKGELQTKTYEPKPGEIIFFDWNVDGHPDHVGLVEKVENGRIYTIEGNSKDECKRKEYPINSKYIHSYGTPLY